MINFKTKKPDKITGKVCKDCGKMTACAWHQGDELCTPCKQLRSKHQKYGEKSKSIGCPKGWKKTMGIKYNEYKI